MNYNYNPHSKRDTTQWLEKAYNNICFIFSLQRPVYLCLCLHPTSEIVSFYSSLDIPQHPGDSLQTCCWMKLPIKIN